MMGDDVLNHSALSGQIHSNDSHQVPSRAINSRLEGIERAQQTTNDLIRRLIETMGGIATNQQAVASNQALIIEALIRVAERLPERDID